ncbi:MAG: hypothetical protein JST22_08635 [Bacteroidetes bacterium]|nr:hypothetical protein [Bacteroidota bacterium]
MDQLELSRLGLLVIALLIPIVGFVMTLSYARKGESRAEQRWRKRHGLLFWALLPGVAGTMTLLGAVHILPDIFGLIGIIVLGGATLFSWQVQQKRREL